MNPFRQDDAAHYSLSDWLLQTQRVDLKINESLKHKLIFMYHNFTAWRHDGDNDQGDVSTYY